MGPSPRVRGKHRFRNDSPHILSLGSIPARAGETYTRHGRPAEPWQAVHPRACGGKPLPFHQACPTSSRWSIPARAGETCYDELSASALIAGPSPRVRGKPPRVSPSIYRVNHGSIPARAGETANEPAIIPFNGSGPSPRVRGKHHPRRQTPCPGRSIPARAGETARR